MSGTGWDGGVVSRDGWHVPDEDLRRYAAGQDAPPWLWSLEAHLVACERCRARLTGMADPQRVAAGWARLDAELDAPAPGLLERLLPRFGVAEHTARLLVATTALRLSWLAGIALTLLLSAVGATAARTLSTPIVFLAAAPLLPLAGVAVSFGPRVDPAYEIALVAPLHTFRLLLLRCAAVLVPTTALSAATAMALPRYGLVALGWFLPSLTVTLLSLALTPRLGPVTAAVVAAAGWLALLVATVRPDTGGSVLFASGGQAATVVVGAMAAAAVFRLSSRFEVGTRFAPTTHQSRRNA